MPKIVTVEISDDVADVLRRSVADGQKLLLPPKLDRPLYLKVDKVLKLLGGAWSRNVGAHVFDGDAKTAIDAALSNGRVVDEQKSYQAFYTPDPLAEYLVDLAKAGPSDLALEPSAGTGQIVRQLRKRTRFIDACEIRLELKPQLESLGAIVVCDDFLKFSPGPSYSVIVANPPFSGGQDAQHIDHMLDCLEPGGRLISVASAAVKFRKDNKYVGLVGRLRREAKFDIVDSQDGVFEDSGTMVRTCVIVAEKKTV